MNIKDDKLISSERILFYFKYDIIININKKFLCYKMVNNYGANINRKTVDNINSAEFVNASVTNLFSNIVKKIEIVNIK